MKRAIFAGTLAVMVLLSFGAVLLTPAEAERPAQPAADAPVAEAEAAAPAEETPAAPRAAAWDAGRTVSVRRGEACLRLPLEEYLTGVVLAEMPPSFQPAALEAQAVAARTFTLRRMEDPKHGEAAVCADSRCCQAYLDPEQVREKLGDQAAAYEEKVRAAVAATDGLVVTYDGALIDAVYFSCAGGSTEAAAAVWGGEVAYLQPVESGGEAETRYDGETVRVSAPAFREAILGQCPQAALEGAPAGWFGAVRPTAGDGVDTLEIGGVPVEGVRLRQLFALRSTCFTVAVEGEDIVFTTRGSGHRVGMSQYGAQAMALAGADFREILTHYYTGVAVEPAEAEKRPGTS